MSRPNALMRSPSTSDELSQDQYAAQMKQLDSEAFYTFAAAILVTLVFWLAIFLTHDLSITFMHLPLWFVLSCLGGYIFSVVSVIILVKFFLKTMTLKVPSVKHPSCSQHPSTDTVASAATDATAAGTAASSGATTTANAADDAHEGGR